MEFIKEKIEQILKMVKDDKGFAAKFQKDPCKALELVLGVNLPNDQVNAIIEGVKAKLTADKLGDMAGAIGGLFGKK